MFGQFWLDSKTWAFVCWLVVSFYLKKSDAKHLEIYPKWDDSQAWRGGGWGGGGEAERKIR